jgi:hypothetical protein
MKINKQSITDVSKKFELFAQSMQGCNYVIWIESRKFNYENSSDFKLNNLQGIFSEYNGVSKKNNKEETNSVSNISGMIAETNISQVFEKVRTSLSFSSGDGGMVGESYDESLIISRTTIFWSLVLEEFDLQLATRVFEHIPDHYSHFGFYVMWGFCYIFLNEKDKFGIVVGAGAYD